MLTCGASAGLYVSNDGRGCTFTIWRNAAQHRTWDALALNGAPAHGTVTITENKRVTYKPAKGYAGTDRFVVKSTPEGTLEIKVTVTATGS